VAGTKFRAAEKQMLRCLGWVEGAAAVPRGVVVRGGLGQAVEKVAVASAEAEDRGPEFAW
jgi:hypothetical protein